MNWPNLYGLIVTATGWRPAEIDAMSLCDVLDLLAYWSDNPPVHVILAARYLKRDGRQAGRRHEPLADERGNEAAFDQLGGLMGRAQPMAPYAAQLLDQADAMLRMKKS